MKYTEKNGLKFSAFQLGTVQLGMNYGITGKTEKPDEAYAHSILDTAVKCGVNTLDTANNYGDSERVIGNWLASRDGLEKPLVITKLGPFDHSSEEALRKCIREQAERSLATLGLSTVDVMMLHNFGEYMKNPEVVIDEFRRFKENGKARMIAASAYSDHDYKMIAESGFEAVQIPLNAFDQSRIEDGGVDAIAKAGMLIFTRSVFLQGLVFMDPDNLPAKMSFAEETLRKYKALADKFGMSPEVLALSFVLSVPGVTSVVLGCQTPEQVEANSELIDKTRKLTDSEIEELRGAFSGIDRLVIDPRLWPKE